MGREAKLWAKGTVQYMQQKAARSPRHVPGPGSSGRVPSLRRQRAPHDAYYVELCTNDAVGSCICEKKDDDATAEHHTIFKVNPR